MTANTGESNEQLNEPLAEEKLVVIWLDYPCFYNVRSAKFKDRDRRQQAVEEIAQKIAQNGLYLEISFSLNISQTCIYCHINETSIMFTIDWAVFALFFNSWLGKKQTQTITKQLYRSKKTSTVRQCTEKCHQTNGVDIE